MNQTSCQCAQKHDIPRGSTSRGIRKVARYLFQSRGRRLQFLFPQSRGGSHNGNSNTVSNTAFSPQDVAWLLKIDEDKVAAIARGSVVADLGYEMRLRVRDPLNAQVTFELRRGNRLCYSKHR